MNLRCSSLPLFQLCPASVREADIRLAEDNPPAREGSAVHEALAAWVDAGRPDRDAGRLAAAKWSADPDAVLDLAWTGWRAWEELRDFFPDPKTEVEMLVENVAYGFELTGHADVLSVVDGEVRILDWKTGRKDVDSSEQVRGYCYLGLAHNQPAHSARACVVRLREQSADWSPTWGYGDLAAWFGRLIQRALEADLAEAFGPGPHCGNCQRRLGCDGFRAAMESALTALALSPPGDPEALVDCSNGPQLARLRADVKLIKDNCDVALDVIKAAVRAAGGSLPDGAGGELRVRQQDSREIATAVAWPLLLQTVNQADLLTAAKLSVGKVEALIGATAEKGQKGKKIKAEMARLSQAGAILTKTTDILEHRHGKDANSTASPAISGPAS